MASRYVRVTFEDPTGRRYVGSGKYSDVAQHDSPEKGVARAHKDVAEAFGPGTYEVVDLDERTYDHPNPSHPFKVPTEDEKRNATRNSLVYTLSRKAKEDALALLVDRAERQAEAGARGYAHVADALAWVGPQVMKLDLQRAWAVSILNDLAEHGALVLDYTEDDVLRRQVVADAGSFDEVIEHFTSVAREKALNYSGRSSEWHDTKDQLEREVAAEVFKLLDGAPYSGF